MHIFGIPLIIVITGTLVGEYYTIPHDIPRIFAMLELC